MAKEPTVVELAKLLRDGGSKEYPGLAETRRVVLQDWVNNPGVVGARKVTGLASALDNVIKRLDLYLAEFEPDEDDEGDEG